MSKGELQDLFAIGVTPPSRKDLLLDLAAFLATAGWALAARWQAADVIWASWLASLITGYAFLLAMIGLTLLDEKPGAFNEQSAQLGCLGVAMGGLLAYLAVKAGPGCFRILFAGLLALDALGLAALLLTRRRWFGFDPARAWVRVLAQVPGGLCAAGFFTLHFGGFHAGHAAFLAFLMPPPIDIPARGADAGATAARILGALLKAYWPYVLSVAVANFGLYRRVLRGRHSAMMMLPYKSVVRIHVLIFVLFPIALLRLGRVALVVALAFFFFPLEQLIAWRRARGRGNEASGQNPHAAG
ncbi:MAG: hypothetical protein JXR37_06230 [Kiritimatiellae bacterium]|nr:hypothetical protein [Kiritimatiellia bacterium]